ncbi:D-beta-D-heptose 7-phosphate kinase / D-beta-D-heptose 1-phosphate adenosyltransferase [Chitinophaga rupis]|uniref:D-glycero-beta-D-manno-heptose 1-phosphate adenylyltransferase n=1 Tax=Chitinophaga rupis TaxID=573321 RepID=A0A1H7QXH7_9BACT|nr:D-glycero-beta-D-manno-heptose 1-phosphate adenylyltransferase [Chitinophaga rupis]SEL52579.1 D-beta-D-heptose 7-phosphate kinase / D-beta-D-heptose 1-phosphate adenosyltransferase [Chitinophaga rupis]
MYTHITAQFAGLKILCIGDLMMDVYLRGASTRLSPEAPVPVVNVTSTTVALGGGANTAANLSHLGAQVTYCSVTGADAEGDRACTLLENAGVSCKIIQHSSRNTIVKTRVMAGSQMLTRYDAGSEHAILPEVETAFIQLLQEQYPQHQALVIADYCKGLLTPAVIDALVQLKQAHPICIAVDSKRLEYFVPLRPTLVKPNYKEAIAMLQLEEQPYNRPQQLESHGSSLFERTGATITALTLDEAGALIFEGDKPVYRAFAKQVPSPNVSGAGDTYISAFTLAYLAGANIPAAAEIAGAAAAVAISKPETAHCLLQELDAFFAVNEKYVTDLQQLHHICNIYKAQGKKVVFTNGCFDILHSGHVSYLNRARELGDVLLVGINNDDSIRRLKGSARPVNRLYDRMQVLAGLEAVQHIIPFGSLENDTPAPLIEIIQPHVFAKGGDYTKEKLPEAAVVEQYGGEIVLLPLVPDQSTTHIIRRINMPPALKVAK